MSKLIPDYVFDSIYDITPEVLTAHGVRGVLVDLDGTMASHKAALPPETLYTFVDRLKNAGIAVLVFSNNHPERVGKFCEPLGVGYISHAGKPFSRGFRKAADFLNGTSVQTDVALHFTSLSWNLNETQPPRAPRYSGYYYASTTFEYATIMLYGLSFQKVLLCCFHAMP